MRTIAAPFADTGTILSVAPRYVPVATGAKSMILTMGMTAAMNALAPSGKR